MLALLDVPKWTLAKERRKFTVQRWHSKSPFVHAEEAVFSPRMSSAVHNLQKAILDPNQSLTQLLRQAKLVASKLNLDDVERWVDSELRGYPEDIHPPPYRTVTTMHLETHNPVRGWQFSGNVGIPIPMAKPISEIETLSKGELAITTLPEQIPVRNSLGTSRTGRSA